MRHLSLFSGIGGFDLAAEWMGWENVAQVEIDQFCLEVLKKNFLNTKRYTDIKTFPAANYTRRVDILTGGFPCQPFSQAGKRQGTNDDRHLWPAMLGVIRIIKPTWVIAENVRGLLTIQQGMVFEQVCLDLEASGYEVQPLIIPAVAVNAPHRRDRVWFIAHKRSAGLEEAGAEQQTTGIRGGNSDANDTFNTGLERHTDTDKGQGERETEIRPNAKTSWSRHWPEVAAEFCSVDDGLPVELGRFKLSKSGNRANQIKAYGNAIVPHLAYQIFSAMGLQ